MATSRKRNVEIEFLVDDKQATRSLNNIDKGLTKTGKTFSTAAKVIGGFAIGSVLTNAARESIEAFSNLEQSVGGTEAVFGSASGAIDKFAKKSAQSAGLAESEFRTATTLIGGQLKRMTGDVEFAAEKSIVLTQTAADLAATYGGTTAEAVTALSAAFRGEADPAERFNLNLKISAVNAKAVELGLAETTAAVDDNARAQALLALVAEQSADAQGQFGREADTVAGKAQRLTAELENQKALLGERLAPAYVAGTERLAELTVGFSDLFGLIGSGEAALMRIASQMGVNTDTAEAFATAVRLVQQDMSDFWGVQITSSEGLRLWRKEMEKLIDTSGMSTDELRRLAVSGVDYFTGTLGLSQEQAEFLAKTLEERLITQLNEARGAAQHAATGGIDKYRESTEEATEATDDFIGAQLALANPILAAVRASQQAEEAQRKMNSAIQEYGENSPQAIQATIDYFEALTKADAAAQTWADEGGPAAIQAFENAAREAGISEEVISAVVAALERLNKMPALKNPFVNYPKGTPWLPTGGLPNPNIPAFADGGVVPGPKGAPVLAKVHGGETIRNEAQEAALKNGGGSSVVNYYALSLSDRQLKEHQEMARRS